MKRIIYVASILAITAACKNTNGDAQAATACVPAESDSEQTTEMVEEEQPSSAKEPVMVEEQLEKLKVTNIDDPYYTLGNQAGNSYHARNMFDGKPSTGWALKLTPELGESDMIYGPSMNVNARKLDHIVIQNGYGKSKDMFQKNTRAAWIELYRDSDNPFPEEEDIIYSGPLKDTMSPQRLEINPKYDNSRPTGMVYIRFKGYKPGYDTSGYYKGSKWNDLVISELEFYGEPAK